MEEENIQIPDDVHPLHRENAKSNIRELEGSLVRLLAFSTLTGRDVTVEMAREVLADSASGGAPKKIARRRLIQKAVAQQFDIPIEASWRRRGSRASCSPARSPCTSRGS